LESFEGVAAQSYDLDAVVCPLGLQSQALLHRFSWCAELAHPPITGAAIELNNVRGHDI
jgi:hypothetical protein